MCIGGNKTLGKVLHPIGAIAPKSGIGQSLDPMGFVARKVGGDAGRIISPSAAMRGDFDKKRKPALLTSNTQPKALGGSSQISSPLMAER
jgi:hypothetical protein